MPDIEDVFDYDLWRLDGVSFGAYFTDQLEQFADERMEGGENNIWEIGHDVFRVTDLEASWPRSAIQSSPSPALITGAATASLLYPDRVPWFLFDDNREVCCSATH